MIILISRKVPIQTVTAYFVIVLICCALCYFVGSWTGSEIESDYIFEPATCLVKKSTGNPQWDNRWPFPEENMTGNIDCKDGLKSFSDSNVTVSHVVFSFPFSLDMKSKLLGYQKWIQSLKAYLAFDKKLANHLDNPELIFEAELVYRDDKDPEDKWTFFAASAETRHIHCVKSGLFKGIRYGCTNLPLFQLASVHHDNYLLNIRFRSDATGKIPFISHLKHLKDMHLVLAHENVKFTQAMVYMKSYFCPITLLVHIWFWHVYYERRPALLERALFAHSMALTALNVPIEYISLWVSFPILAELNAVREIIFQNTLFISWIIFYGYLSKEGKAANRFCSYWPYFVPFVFCYFLVMFDDFERTAAFYDPFYSPWNSFMRFRQLPEFDFIIGNLSFLVGMFIMYQFLKIRRNIFVNRSIILDIHGKKVPGDSVCSVFHLLWGCLFFCTAMTVFRFQFCQLLQNLWKFHAFEDYGLKYLPTPGVLTLFFGIWNILSIGALLLNMPASAYNRLMASTKYKDSDIPSYEEVLEMEKHSEFCCLHSQLGMAHWDYGVEKRLGIIPIEECLLLKKKRSCGIPRIEKENLKTVEIPEEIVGMEKKFIRRTTI